MAWHRVNPVSQRLATIPGIGPIIATAIAATVTEPGQFRSGREFAAWLGLVPRQNSTGGKTRLGGISKRGNQYLRRLLINGASANLLRSRATKADPWVLKTPPGTSEYTMYIDDAGDPPAIVCQVGSTTLKYDRRAIDDLHAMLKAHGDWMDLGAADEQKDAKPGTVEAWGRDPSNPVGGWYGLRKGYRGRFGMYMPPLMEALGLAELTHDAKNNRMRAKG